MKLNRFSTGFKTDLALVSFLAVTKEICYRKSPSTVWDYVIPLTSKLLIRHFYPITVVR